MKLLYLKNKQNMKKLFVISLFFFVLSNMFAQQRKIDSLRQAYQKETVDSLKLKKLYKITYYYYTRNSDSFVKYNNILFYTSTKSNNEYYLAHALSSKGKYYNTIKKSDSARYFFRQANKIFQRLKKPVYVAENLTNYAISFMDTKAEDSVKYYLLKALKINEKLNDHYNLFFNYYNLAVQLNKQNENEEAIKYLINAYKEAEQLRNKNYQIYTLNLTGMIYEDMEVYQKALTYYKQANKLAHKINDAYGLGLTYSGIASTLSNSNQPVDSILFYYKKSLLYFKKMNDEANLYTLFHNVGKNYLEKNLDSAKIYLDKSLILSIKYKDEEMTANNYREIGKYYDLTNQLTQAEKYYNKSLKINRKLQNKQRTAETLIYLSELKSKQGKTKEALRLYKEGDSILDAVTSKEKLKTIKEIETKYQTAKKEKENALLKKQKAEQELEIAKRKRQNLIYAGGLGVSLLSMGIFFFFFRRNVKQKRMILELQRELHHRIKNNLRVITAFINSIKEKFENKEKVDVQEVNEQLNELEKRVQTIYNLHKQLYEGAKVTHLDLDKYINLLTETIAANYDKAVEMELDIPEETKIKADHSIILGLILT